MPITLGCPSCAKKFRARDESAGKKVKCPYCQAAVQVPTAEEAESARAGTDLLPPSPGAFSAPPPPSRPAMPPAPKSGPLGPPAARPTPAQAPIADWGAETAVPAGSRAAPGFSEPEPPPPPRPGRGRPAPRPEPLPTREADKEKAAEKTLIKRWTALRRGLFWVTVAVFFLALPAFVEFGKAVYARSEGDAFLKGPGQIQIDNYVNDPNDKDSVPLSKKDEIHILAYGAPALLGAFFLTLGGLIASGAPRKTGSGGMFAFGGLFALLAFIGIVAYFGMDRMLMPAEARLAKYAAIALAIMSQLWFLIALASCGGTVGTPKAARAAGTVVFLAAVVVGASTLGWEFYEKEYRPKAVDADVIMYEQAVFMLLWLMIAGIYWRAVRAVRVGARKEIEELQEAA